MNSRRGLGYPLRRGGGRGESFYLLKWTLIYYYPTYTSDWFSLVTLTCCRIGVLHSKPCYPTNHCCYAVFSGWLVLIRQIWIVMDIYVFGNHTQKKNIKSVSKKHKHYKLQIKTLVIYNSSVVVTIWYLQSNWTKNTAENA